MINLSGIIENVRSNAKEHSPELLTAGATVGVLSTVYLTIRATIKATRKIDAVEKHQGRLNDPKERWKERTKLVGKLYIPPAISATSTIVCIVGSNRISSNKAVAAQTALAVTQSAYSEYREQVIGESKVRTHGERKDESIRAKAAQNRVDNTEPSNADVLMVGEGEVLCFEYWTGRYFKSDIETLKKAVNDINLQLLKHDYATMDDFYYLIGLEGTQASNNTGWKSDKHLELLFASVLKNGKPAMSFEYNYVTTL